MDTRPGDREMKSNVQTKLSAMVVELDLAIARAIEDPSLFADQPLANLAANCLELASLEHPDLLRSQGLSAPAWATESAQREALLWQIRSRAGRLQMLLESARHFYSNCFSLSQPEGLAYGVHGEWGTYAPLSHLIVDC